MAKACVTCLCELRMCLCLYFHLYLHQSTIRISLQKTSRYIIYYTFNFSGNHIFGVLKLFLYLLGGPPQHFLLSTLMPHEKKKTCLCIGRTE